VSSPNVSHDVVFSHVAQYSIKKLLTSSLNAAIIKGWNGKDKK
jgi:hypothetical protein